MAAWLWLNALCLDAPIVALVWQDFLAQCFAIPLRPTGRFTLGLTVWAIYLGDRLLDVRLPQYGEETAAHRFCRKNRGWAYLLITLVLAADLIISFLWLRRSVFWNGLVVIAAVAAYFAAFPMSRRAARWKPVAAAVLFTVGVFLVAWTRSGGASEVLAGPAVTFGALCLVNLFLIRAWELGERVRGLGFAAVWLAGGCLAAASWMRAGAVWYVAAALAAAGLAVLAFAEERIAKDGRRVLADAVLLSPLVLWISTR
jgi:hypothetical protein